MILTKKNMMWIISLIVLLIIFVFSFIKVFFFKNASILEPIKIVKDEMTVMEPNNKKDETNPTSEFIKDEFEIDIVEKETTEVFEENTSTIIDDGSIVYDGLTLTELTDKLNRSLNSDLANTGYYFAEFTKRTGLDPYLSVAIVLLETGCTWQCSTFTVQCNNIGGLKGHGSCNGTSYSKYDSLDEGINAYLNIIYNGYYLKGLTTPELMNPKYAESTEWARKVNTYIEKIKAA